MGIPNNQYYQASISQKSLWFLANFENNSPTQNIIYCWKIAGNFSINAIEQSLNFLVSQHQCLRSSFIQEGNVVLQNVKKSLTVKIVSRQIDQEQLNAQIKEFSQETFLLNEAPLFKVKLFTINKKLGYLCFSFHHIICDGWSMGVFFEGLSLIYSQIIESKKPNLGYLPEDFSDFNKDNLEDINYIENEALVYWKETLKEHVNFVVPPDKQNMSDHTFNGDREINFINKEITEKLDSVAFQYGCSTYILLLTAYIFLLHRLTGQQDISIGAPIANRLSKKYEKTIGYFVNTVVIRVHFTKNKILSFNDLLVYIKNFIFNALEFQSFPFERVVENLKPERFLSHNPLYQNMFSFEDVHVRPLLLKGCEVSSVDPNTGISKFDLECTIWRKEDILKFRLTYNSDLYESITAKSYLYSYIELLKLISNKSLNTITLDYNIFLDFDKTYISFLNGATEKYLEKTVIHKFIQVARDFPNRIAVNSNGKKITYRELEEVSEATSSYLLSLGAKGCIALELKPGINLIIIILALMRAGLTLVPLNPDDPLKRKEQILQNAQASLLITEFNNNYAYPSPKLKVEVAINEAVNFREAGSSWPDISGQSEAYIIYTSGTTGIPKGVSVNHNQLLNTIKGCSKNLAITDVNKFVSWSSYAFDIFYLEIFMPLIKGAELSLISREEILDVSYVLQALKITECIHAVPGLMEEILNIVKSSNAKTLSNIKLVLVGGDTVPSQLLYELQCIFPTARINVLYGPTEATIISTTYQYDIEKKYNYRNIIGSPLPNVYIVICDKFGNTLPRGCIGEIVIGGDSVANGYINVEAREQATFTNLNGKRVYKSGDLGRLTFDSKIEYYGREDTQVKLRGFRINLNEITSCLNKLPYIKSAITTFHQDDRGEKEIIPYCIVDWEKFNVDDGELVKQWYKLFETTHEVSSAETAEDYSGWISAITGKPLDNNIMKDWRDSTIKSILKEIPPERLNKKDVKILEIGCGTGLLLFPLVKYCSLYIATDMSKAIISKLANQIAEKNIKNVMLYLYAAHDVFQYLTQKYDIIIINSVSQYFPSAKYFKDIVAGALTYLNDEGFLFIGDVRGVPNINGLYQEIIHYKYNKLANYNKLLPRIISSEHYYEDELLIHPMVFQEILKGNSYAFYVEPRLDNYDTELLRYRYNAVIKKNATLVNIDWLEYNNILSLKEDLIAFIKKDINNICGYRNVWTLACEGEMRKFINFRKQVQLIVDAANLFVRFSLINSDHDLRIDMVIYKSRIAYLNSYFLSDDNKDAIAFFEEPIKKHYCKLIENKIISYLSENKPRYMVPKQIEFIEKINLGHNDKINFKDLPAPRYIYNDTNYIPPTSYLETELCEVWKKILGQPKIGIDDNFFAFGGTSLLVIQMVVKLRALNINLRPQAVFQYQTIREISEFITSHHTGSLIAASLVTKRQFSDFKQVAPIISPKVTQMRRVLLLGSTGFLGSHLLHDVLKEPQCEKIYCLVRGENLTEVRLRLSNNFKYYYPNDELDMGKVNVLCGDATLQNFGLDSDVWKFLSNDIDTIINSSALVSHIGERDSFHTINVDSVHNIVNLAELGKGKKIIHVSTIGVKGFCEIATKFTEASLDIGQSLTDYYSESKLNAEIILNKYKLRGGDVQIFRAGTVAPQSITGVFQKNIQNHFFTRFLHSVINLQVAPNWAHRYISLTPVDIMAKMIINLSKNSYDNSVFHINNNYKISYTKIFAWLGNCGYDIKIIPETEFIEKILKISSDEYLSKYLGGVIQLVDTKNINHNKLNDDITRNYLRDINISYPEINYDWFEKFIMHAINVGYLPEITKVATKKAY